MRQQSRGRQAPAERQVPQWDPLVHCFCFSERGREGGDRRSGYSGAKEGGSYAPCEVYASGSVKKEKDTMWRVLWPLAVHARELKL